MNKTKFTLGKCSIPVFFATNCTKDKGCSFKFGVKVVVGESIENVPLVYSGIHNRLFNANFHAKLKKTPVTYLMKKIQWEFNSWSTRVGKQKIKKKS
jgi:hypothetical protein